MAGKTRKHLWDLTCKQAKAKPTPYKLSDGDGMYLFVTPSGGKLWRVDYRFGGKRKTASLGAYPETSLDEARELRRELRQKLKQGIDPMAERKGRPAPGPYLRDGFEIVAREWHTNRAPQWTPRHAGQVLRLLERDIFPAVGNIPIREITPLDLLEPLRVVEARGTLDVLAAIRSCLGRIFRYAIATGRAERDVSADLRDAFQRHEGTHYASLRPDELPDLLNALDAHKDPENRLGLLGIKLILLTLVRSTELREARWVEFDFGKAQWVIPPERMKMRREHVVPLSRQTVVLLKELRAETNNKTYLFPTRRKEKSEFASRHVFLRVLDALGFKDKTTIHGLRSTGSTILHESGKFRSLVIERQLAHEDADEVRGIYNKAQYLEERRIMMQWWADYLDEAAAKKG